MSTKRILASLGLVVLLSTSAVAAPSFSVSKSATEFSETISPETIEAVKKQQAEKKATVADSRFMFRRISDADLAAFVKAFPDATNIEIHSSTLTSFAPLAELKNLKRIRARAPKVTSMAPLADNTTLTSMDIDYNATGQDLKWMSKLTNLTGIYLVARGLSSVEGMPTLPKLSIINLEHIAAPNLEAFAAALPNLRVANLRYGTFTDVSALTKMPHLASVSFYGAVIKDFSPLATATKLKQFNYYAVKGADFSTLGTLKQVQLMYGGLTDLDSIAWIQDMPKLKLIHFFDEKITDYSPLKNAPNLVDVKIWKMKAPVGDLAFLKPLKNLETLTIQDNTGVSGFEVLNEFTKMERLSLLKNNGKEIPLIKFGFLQNMPGLKRLQASNFIVENLDLHGLKELTYVQLDDMNLGDDSKAMDLSLIKDLPKLRTLDIRNSKVSNFQNMDNMPALSSLSLMKSTGITDFSVLSKFPKLKTLNVSKDGFTEAQLATVPKGIRVNKR